MYGMKLLRVFDSCAIIMDFESLLAMTFQDADRKFTRRIVERADALGRLLWDNCRLMFARSEANEYWKRSYKISLVFFRLYEKILYVML